MNKYVQDYGYEFVKVLTDFGIDVDVEERFYSSSVVAYCERKAELDNAPPKYKCILGLCYFLGYGVEQRNIEKAKDYINAVANPGEGKKPYLPAIYLMALSYEYEAQMCDGNDPDYNKKWSEYTHNAFKCYMRYIISEEDMQLEATKRLKGQALYVVANGYKNGYHVKSGEGGYLDDHTKKYGDLEEFEYYSTMARAKYKNEQAIRQNEIRQKQNDEEILLRLKELRKRRLQKVE